MFNLTLTILISSNLEGPEVTRVRSLSLFLCCLQKSNWKHLSGCLECKIHERQRQNQKPPKTSGRGNELLLFPRSLLTSCWNLTFWIGFTRWKHCYACLVTCTLKFSCWLSSCFFKIPTSDRLFVNASSTLFPVIVIKMCLTFLKLNQEEWKLLVLQ